MNNYIDLFSGAGGLSEGFVEIGFQPIISVEADKAACYTLKTRVAYHYLKSAGLISVYIQYLEGKINRDELYSNIPKDKLDVILNQVIGKANNNNIFKEIDRRLKGAKVDLIIGGPPCQAYSLVGRARSSNGMEGDSRNYLFIEYARYIQRYKPKMFLFENVMGLKSANKGAYYRRMLLTFRNITGYNVKEYNVNSNDFGVLQNRNRIILIGCRKDLKIDFPNIQSKKSDFQVSEIFNDLPKIDSGGGIDKFTQYSGPNNKYLEITGIRGHENIVTQHICRPNNLQDKEIYRIAVEKWNEKGERLNYNELPENLKTHVNRASFFDRFKVVAANLPYSQTITAHISKDGNYYIHPDINQNRSISVREAARLQSFPDDYYFEGIKQENNRSAAFKQIGNAVPPLMSKIFAFEIKKALEKLSTS